ncbi:hypothetical protein F0562_022546 [Nyssa sinensis]|uniref:Uncharacterized protein n=1 Tax=Nyssa sinensis TaxID=561372 RepID=A0A5J5BPH7_9ASTE|nr:hypothetical protein F0562_022546 [Nyssa sinensis]
MPPRNSRVESSRVRQAIVTLSSDDDCGGGDEEDSDSDNGNDNTSRHDGASGGNFVCSQRENRDRQSPSGFVLTEEQESGPAYAPARHSTTDWM